MKPNNSKDSLKDSGVNLVNESEDIKMDNQIESNLVKIKKNFKTISIKLSSYILSIFLFAWISSKFGFDRVFIIMYVSLIWLITDSNKAIIQAIKENGSNKRGI
jgi:hypothetical protein